MLKLDCLMVTKFDQPMLKNVLIAIVISPKIMIAVGKYLWVEDILNPHVKNVTRLGISPCVKNQIYNDFNVLPVGDINPHTESSDCPCNPAVEIIGAKLYIIHNAWDNRELFEEINQAIKEKVL